MMNNLINKFNIKAIDEYNYEKDRQEVNQSHA